MGASTPGYRSPTASGGSELQGSFGPTSLPAASAPTTSPFGRASRKKKDLGKVKRRGNMTKRAKY